MVELIWEGKYRDGKRVAPTKIALPFQTVETVNESAQERQRQFDLFSTGRDPEWRNRLIWGDKKYVLPSLLPEFAGKIDLIYIDPPFDTGADFSFNSALADDPGTAGDDSYEFRKQPSMLEVKAYRDTWAKGLDSYVGWVAESIAVLRELLSEHGNFFLHLGANVAAYLRPVLDEVFGANAYTNEIIWKRSAAHSDTGQGAAHLGRLHDTIFWYRACETATVNMQFEPYSADYATTFYKYVDPGTGRRFALDNTSGPGGARKGNPYYEFRGVSKYWRYAPERTQRLYEEGRLVQSKDGRDWRYKRYLDEMPGVPIQDMWTDIPPLQSQNAERTGYETQKPERFLERVIKLASNPGDLVLDCFCGSGTTPVVAEKLGRRWIAADLGRFAVHVTRKRLLGLPEVKPFAVQNLGKYERQAWQTAEFGEQAEQTQAAYRRFILDLYRAEPAGAYTSLHGMKAGRWVHVGAVDSPVAEGDLTRIANELRAAGGSRVDILGWDFAFAVNEVGKQRMEHAGIQARYLKIPREVLEKRAVEQGDIQFFELGVLGIEVGPLTPRPPLPLRGRGGEDGIPLARAVGEGLGGEDGTPLPLAVGEGLGEEDGIPLARAVGEGLGGEDGTPLSHGVGEGLGVRVTLTDFIVRLDDLPEDARKHITHWSQMLDYWAVDWDFKGDTFHNQWQSYRTRKDPSLALSATHEYPEPGEYRVMVKAIDILGNDTTTTLTLTPGPSPASRERGNAAHVSPSPTAWERGPGGEG